MLNKVTLQTYCDVCIKQWHRQVAQVVRDRRPVLNTRPHTLTVGQGSTILVAKQEGVCMQSAVLPSYVGVYQEEITPSEFQ